MGNNTEMRVRRYINFNDISWHRCCESLCKNFDLSIKQANNCIASFRRKFLRPLNLNWFLTKLSTHDNFVLTALCECNGADILVISHSRRLWLCGLQSSCRQEIEFRPDLKSAQHRSPGGNCTARMWWTLLRKTLYLDSFSKLLALQIAAFILAVLFYVLIAGSFLYSLSVFILFLIDPLQVALAATTRGSIGIALLSFLVCIAAVGGKILKSLLSILIERFSPRLRHDKALCDQKLSG